MVNEILGQPIVRRELVRQSKRFRDEHVFTKDGEFFVKTAIEPEFNDKIVQQVEASAGLAELLRNVDWLEVEKVVDHGGDWLAARWLPDGQLATPEQFTARQNLESLGDFVRIVARLNELAIPSGESMLLGRRTWLEFRKRSEGKLQPLLGRYDWDKKKFKAYLDYIESRQSDFVACWQHGDLEPWHVIKSGDRFVLVDCEHAHDQWPKYYDIANFYSKLIVRFDLKAEADNFLAEFIKLSKEPADKSKAFWALVALRSVGRLIEHHDEPEIVQRAFALLDKIVKE